MPRRHCIGLIVFPSICLLTQRARSLQKTFVVICSIQNYVKYWDVISQESVVITSHFKFYLIALVIPCLPVYLPKVSRRFCNSIRQKSLCNRKDSSKN